MQMAPLVQIYSQVVQAIWGGYPHKTNISPTKGAFEDDFPFHQVGYVSSLECIVYSIFVSCYFMFYFCSFFGVFSCWFFK